MFAFYFPTAAEAVQAWLHEALRFADGKGRTLYWRDRPELDEMSAMLGLRRRIRKEKWAVYSRFWIAA
jgi:hypothetical protein